MGFPRFSEPVPGIHRLQPPLEGAAPKARLPVRPRASRPGLGRALRFRLSPPPSRRGPAVEFPGVDGLSPPFPPVPLARLQTAPTR